MTLDEAMFLRLLPRYDRIAEEDPPFSGATVEQAVAYMRQQLSAPSRRDGPPLH